MTKDIKIIILVAAGILILGGVLAFSEPQGDDGQHNLTRQEGPTFIEAEHTSHDFGNISMKDGKVEHVYKVKNNSDQAVEIDKVYTSCMCTEALLAIDNEHWGPYGMPGHGSQPSLNKIIEPGQELDLKVIYDPNAHGPAGIGATSRQIAVETKQGSPLVFDFTANVTP